MPVLLATPDESQSTPGRAADLTSDKPSSQQAAKTKDKHIMPFAVPAVINDTVLLAELARVADLARLAFTPVPHSPITSDNDNYRSQPNGRFTHPPIGH